jgi:hypothetical protein
MSQVRCEDPVYAASFSLRPTVLAATAIAPLLSGAAMIQGNKTGGEARAA